MSEFLFTRLYDWNYKVYELRLEGRLAGYIWIDANRAWRFQQDDDFGGFTIPELQEITKFMQGLEEVKEKGNSHE